MKFSASQELKAAVGIVADNHAAGTVNGTGIDTLGFGEALIVVNSGTNGTSGTVDIKLQESSDDAATDAYADITGATFTQITESNDNAVYVGRVNLNGDIERYIRVVAVVATAACDLGVSVILLDAKNLPVSQTNTVAFSV